MHTRRSFLAAVGVGATASIAGCTGAITRTGGSDADAVPEGWSTGRAMPRAQGDAGSAVLDGKLYAFGGIASGGGLDAVARGFAYDPTDGGLGSWESVPDMPRALWGPSGVASSEAIYSFGGAPADSPYGTGRPPSDEIFTFVPGEGWTDLTAERGVRCPYPTWAMQSVFDPDSGLIYNVGGATFSEAAGQGNEDRVWTFDPERDEVADPDLTRLPTGRRWPAVALTDVDGRPTLHVIGGIGLDSSDATHRYDPEADEWKSMRRAPRKGMYATTSNPVIDGSVYLTHGLFWVKNLGEDDYELACHRYDPGPDEWTTEGLGTPTYRRAAGAADGVVDGTLYVAGGHVKHYDDGGFHEAVPYLEAFRPA